MKRPSPDEARGWRRLAWRAYTHLPRAADGLLAFATRAMLPIVNRRLAMTVLRGPVACGGTASMLIAGAGGAEVYLARRFFAAEPAREDLAPVPVWRLREALARRHDDVDLVVARLDCVSARRALDPSYVAVPEWVGALVPVPDDPWKHCRRSKSLHNNVARVRRAGFRAEVSHELADFHAFYEQMYVPFIRGRHGAESVVSHRARLERCFRQGGIVWALDGDRRVAGVLVRQRGTTLDLVVVGTAGGTLEPARSGAVFAIDLFALEHARALGCTMVDFGGSRASPSDGLLLYKARWGARVLANRTTFYDLCLSWRRLTPPLLALLAHTPLIFRQADGLAALWSLVGACNDAPPEIAAAAAVLRSLRRIYLLGGTDGDSPILPIPSVRIDPAAQPSWHPPRDAAG